MQTFAYMRGKLNLLLVIHAFFIGFSMAIGILMRPFYDWTGADQSRASPVVLPIAVSLLLACIFFCVALPWIPFPKTADSKRPYLTFQLRGMLLWIAVIALLIVIARYIPAIWITGALLAGAVIYWVWLVFLYKELRSSLFVLFSVMYFPYLWVLESLREQTQILAIIGCLPSFLPTAFLGAMIQTHEEQLLWFMYLLSAFQLWLGCSLFRVRERLGLGYTSFLFLLSIYGSFALHSLFRM